MVVDHETSQSIGTASNDTNDGKKKKDQKPMASLADTFGFVFGCGGRVTFLFAVGSFTAVMHGLVFPALAYLFSNSFSDLSVASVSGAMDQIEQLAIYFMLVGLYALVTATIQTWAFELVAFPASRNFRLKWFQALLRQDSAFYDVYDIGGMAGQVGTNANKFRRGVGRKFGEGIQFLTTGVGGLAYAFFSDWSVALVILAAVPFISLAMVALMSLNQKRGTHTAESYKRAGGVAYSAVSSIKTVLSLNAVKDMVSQYKEATMEAFNSSISFLIKQGLANGTMMGSMLFLYAILTLYGTFLIYRDVAATGCDPSGGVSSNETCTSSAAGVFGAMLGVAFAAQGLGQVGNFTESLAAARVAVYQARLAIKRKPGSAEEIFYKTEEDNDHIGSSTHSSKNTKDTCDIENGEPVKKIRAILPKFEIDSLSSTGVRPSDTRGAITFENVNFAYPTRADDLILDGLSLEIQAGKTIALVGPSGGGKSTIVSLLERFYDPVSGKVCMDGINIKDINVVHLRKSIGYVGQEPTLFATTIQGNIQYGNPHATQQQIEEAARLSNAHDFIMSFPDGYSTQVGDKGSQLSGGQKQRIAIARILVGDPKILLLDEATSALDSESELIVQEALDNIIEHKKITTIIIAHRLSTIRNADTINVIISGKVKEQGTHDQLMATKSYYRQLVEKQEGVVKKQEGVDDKNQTDSHGSSQQGIELDLSSLADSTFGVVKLSIVPHIEFKNVSFSYPSRPQKKIFDNFSLVIEQGQTVALVGPSGGGKSTVVGLIERFYDPDPSSGGQILYLGNDVRSLNVEWFRSQLSFVGQEPVLFNMSIAANIAFGSDGATWKDIEEAAKQANAHDFVIGFPEAYDTPVGSRGTQLSGGQKQRIAIARALIRKPRVLILDEATSALDNESEAIVQEAIDTLMQSRDHTVIVIAHRLSTIRNADRIALISSGKVLEYGSHDELIEKPQGRYKRLMESSKRCSTVDSVGLQRSMLTIGDMNEDEEEEEKEGAEEINWKSKIKEEEVNAFSAKKARQMAKPDVKYLLAGSVGALLAGGIFPLWGVLFSQTINLLFRPVVTCPLPDGRIPEDFPSCSDYWDSTASDMRQKSFQVAVYWAILIVACILGNVVTFWGFGTASERLNKRVRDSSFLALLRQEVGFYDKRSVGSITSQLQDDAARIHAFSGEPVRSFLTAIASCITGIILSFYFMWQFALVAIGVIPIMSFATMIEMKRYMGEDEAELVESTDELHSPGGIIVETLLNMRTVSALTLEEQRFEDYERALTKSEPHYRRDAFISGLTGGFSMCIQQWINALLFWFGGWLLFNFPEDYSFNDYLISQFSILFGLFGLAAAFQDMSDRKEVEESAGRILYLLDRDSEIDPLSPEGLKLD